MTVAPDAESIQLNGTVAATRSITPHKNQTDRVTTGIATNADGTLDVQQMYSDGSIEAQMPEGMMRFASIEELRAHLDQRP